MATKYFFEAVEIRTQGEFYVFSLFGTFFFVIGEIRVVPKRCSVYQRKTKLSNHADLFIYFVLFIRYLSRRVTNPVLTVPTSVAPINVECVCGVTTR